MKRIGFGAFGLAFAVGLYLAFGETLRGFVSEDALRETLSDAGAWAPLLFVAVMALVVIVPPLPSLPVDLVGGALFGWFWGGLLVLIGATLGATIAFSLARALGQGAVARRLGGHVAFCSACSDHTLTGAVLVSRLIPFVSFDLVSYGAGLTAMSRARFVLATFVGGAPLSFAAAALGTAVSLEGPWPWLLGGVAALGLVIVPRALESRGWIDPEAWHGVSADVDSGDDAE